MNRPVRAPAALLVAGTSVVLIAGCGSGGSSAASGGSGNKTQICSQFKTLNTQLNKSTAPTSRADAVKQLGDAKSKVQALAQQSTNSKVTADLNRLVTGLGKEISAIQSGNSGNSGAMNAASQQNDSAVKALGSDCGMNFNSGSSGSSGNSGTSTTNGSSGSSGSQSTTTSVP